MRVELQSAEVDNAARNLVVDYTVHGESEGGSYWLNPFFYPDDADPSVYDQERFITGTVIDYGIDSVTATFDLASAQDGDTVTIDAALSRVEGSLDNFDKSDPDASNYTFEDQLISDITVDLPTLDESKVSVDGCVSSADTAEAGSNGFVEVDLVNNNDVSVTAIATVEADGTQIGESFATLMDANEQVTIEVDVEFPSTSGTYDLTAEVSEAY